MPAGCLACGFSRGAAMVAALALRRGDAPFADRRPAETGAVTEDRRGLPRCGGARRLRSRHAHQEES